MLTIDKQKLIQGGAVFLIATLAAVMVSYAQPYFPGQKHAAVIVVDTAGIMIAKQNWFTKELTKPGISDADRGKVMEQTKQFVVDLDRELSKMQQDCQCVIFDKGAVVIGNYVEVTADLKKKLNI